MKKNPKAAITVVMLLVWLAIPAVLVAQEHQKHSLHYKVIDTGSLGGPSSHMSVGAHILNNNGMFTGRQ